MDLGEFGRAAREVDPKREPDTFAFFGERFTVADEIGLMPLMEFAKAAESGADTSEMSALAAMHDMLRDCLTEGEWDRFRDTARRSRATAEEIMGVCTAVYGAIAGRPTRQPSDSSGGLSTTGVSSKGVSPQHAALGLVPVDSLLAG